MRLGRRAAADGGGMGIRRLRRVGTAGVPLGAEPNGYGLYNMTGNV